MADTVHVASIEAIVEFKATMASFADDTRAALVTIELEVRRAVEFISRDRAAHWQSELRNSWENVSQAKDNLMRAKTFKRMDDYVPSCVDEQKQLQRAKLRMENAERKVEAVRHWSRAAQHEVDEFAGRIAQLNGALDVDVPRALAVLHRMIDALDSYVAIEAPASTAADDAASVARPLDSILQGRAQTTAGEAAGDEITVTPKKHEPGAMPAEIDDIAPQH